MISYKKQSLLLYVLLIVCIFKNICVNTIELVYAFDCQTCIKKKAYQYNSQVTVDQKIQQLIQISDAHSQCLIQLQQQLAENQQDIDILRGCLQDIQHHISELVYNQKDVCNKFNQLLNDHAKNISVFNNDLVKDVNNISNNKKLKDHDNEYKTAVMLVLEKKQYEQAIQEFQKFIKNHPQSQYQPNAHYWLGQLNYNQGKKKDAAYHFAWVVKNYPQSSKASDALLKIGIIMQETDQKDKAKTIYKQIGKLYPNSDANKQAQKRLMYL